MSDRTFFATPSLTIPFELCDRVGQVSVYYGANDDSCHAGFDALPGLSLPLDLCVGYPAMQAVIDRYDGDGYRELCGWIQIITRYDTCVDASGCQAVKRTTSIDMLPALDDMGMPFCVFGMLPTLFDAPCMNLGDSQALEWVADTWLVSVPMRSRQEPIIPLLGYRWGYREYDAMLGKPVELLPLVATTDATWDAHLALLRQECPSWRFGPPSFVQ